MSAERVKRGGPSLHAFIMREAASTGQRKDVLTDAQRRILRFLDLAGARAYQSIKPGHVAMLRTMEERGLVSRGSISNPRPKWAITAAGRAALEAAGDRS